MGFESEISSFTGNLLAYDRKEDVLFNWWLDFGIAWVWCFQKGYIFSAYYQLPRGLLRVRRCQFWVCNDFSFFADVSLTHPLMLRG